MFHDRRWPRGRRLRLVRRGAIFVTLAAAVWIGGLVWFATQVPTDETPDRTKTDAIVVLTGGTGRLETGLQLLEDGLARQLFISGVAHGVDVAALLRVAQRKPNELACCIAVGYRADNTAGNATETAEWVAQRGLKSIRLVTASYHMPRSLLEFRHAMPDIRIVPHPVFPPRYKGRRWWLWPGTATLLSSEFGKFVMARAGLSVGDVARRNRHP